MAYDLHVVRTKDWLDASTDPVTKSEVDALIAGDPELSWSSSDYMEMKEGPDVVVRYYAIKWNDEPCFFWYRNEIRCCGPSEAQVRKLVEIAGKLGAYTVGDEGERYELQKSFFGKPKVVSIGPDA